MIKYDYCNLNNAALLHINIIVVNTSINQT